MKDYIKYIIIMVSMFIAGYMCFYAGKYKASSEIYKQHAEEFMRQHIIDLIRFEMDVATSNTEAVE